MIPFSVSSDCRALGLRAGAIVLRDVDVRKQDVEIRRQIDATAACVQREFTERREIRLLPEIAAIHAILREVQVKARRHPPSTQKLLEFAWKHKTLPAVNSFVDFYNWVSVRTRCSLGAHDLERIALPVELRIFRGDETFEPLGGSAVEEAKRGEFGYVDANQRVLCRLDSRQAEFSKVTVDTRQILLIIESVAQVSDQKNDEMLSQTMEDFRGYGSGSIEQIVGLTQPPEVKKLI